MFLRRQLAVAVWRAPAEARQRGAAGVRLFSTTRVAREADFYEVLRLPRNASRAQIKSQFYKLSKEYHPDISGTEDAKAKFQQVSEAYATLGNDKARREYDQRFAARSLAGVRTGGGGATAAENQTRRSTANYAWDYQRRQTARQQKASQAAGATSAGAERFRAAQQTPTGASNLFSRMMERESRLERQRMQSGPQGPRGNPDTFKGYSSRRWSEAEREVEATSPVKRFLQVGCVLGGAIWLSAKIIWPSESP